MRLRDLIHFGIMVEVGFLESDGSGLNPVRKLVANLVFIPDKLLTSVVLLTDFLLRLLSCITFSFHFFLIWNWMLELKPSGG